MLWDYAATWTGCSTGDDGTTDPPTYLTVCHTENLLRESPQETLRRSSASLS
jgi:hypothetical protein